ncbi:beta-1,3-galactosyltransferase pvg3-like [Typha latifolia]|uniref:beta-1,3-galactosyltransferase pvg3-like n=1 Tax=Typha latifolia TaxID=4733 RepID=UPI003C2E57F7
MSSICKQSPSTISLVVLLLPFLTYLLLRTTSISISFDHPSVTDFVGPVTVKPDFRLLIGILTHPDNFERRHLLRLVYSLQSSLTADIDIRFVFCKLTNQEQSLVVSLEIMRYDDIIILNCTESMNFGKTYDYFSSLPELFDDRRYDYVMKMDDDTYFRLDNLVESLKNKSREDMYYGLIIPCDGENFPPFPAPFMTGMGYILSWDLVEWIATSEIARNESIGPEDMMVGKWLSMGNKGKNRHGTEPDMYDYKGSYPSNCFRHELVPDTIAVHLLKNNSWWARTLKYFNVTDGLKPSKLYHVL